MHTEMHLKCTVGFLSMYTPVKSPPELRWRAFPLAQKSSLCTFAVNSSPPTPPHTMVNSNAINYCHLFLIFI